MAESVDALVSNTSGAIHPGSIPGLGTKIPCKSKIYKGFFFLACAKSVTESHSFKIKYYF